MDLDRLIQHLNTVEPRAMDWRALADSTSQQGQTSHSTAGEPAATTAPFTIEAGLLQRLRSHLGDQAAPERQASIQRIVNQALEDWLQARGA